jgi:tRNA(fMet)-specific endonuclease VapC
MTYFFDTNIILAYLRQNRIADTVTAILSLTETNRVYISVVTIGEIWSIATQNNWGSARRTKLEELLDSYIQISVVENELLIRYAEIDAFSQNKLPNHPLGDSARNMGKNDLWIAASASLLSASLITTDKDFDHLHGRFIEVIWIDPSKHP